MNIGWTFFLHSILFGTKLKHFVSHLPKSLGALEVLIDVIEDSLFTVLCLVAHSCPTLCDPKDCSPPGSSVHGDSTGKNTEVGCHALLQGVFPTQGSNPGHLHCGQILHHLSHQGRPRILAWVAYPFSRGTSRPRNQTRVSWIVGGFFTSWATETKWKQARGNGSSIFWLSNSITGSLF